MQEHTIDGPHHGYGRVLWTGTAGVQPHGPIWKVQVALPSVESFLTYTIEHTLSLCCCVASWERVGPCIVSACIYEDAWPPSSLPRQAQVYKVGWWMAHYGASSPKREKMYANNPTVGHLCMGTLTKSQRATLTLKTTKRTPGGGYQGTKQLKSTQPPSWEPKITFEFWKGKYTYMLQVLNDCIIYTLWCCAKPPTRNGYTCCWLQTMAPIATYSK